VLARKGRHDGRRALPVTGAPPNAAHQTQRHLRSPACSIKAPAAGGGAKTAHAVLGRANTVLAQPRQSLAHVQARHLEAFAEYLGVEAACRLGQFDPERRSVPRARESVI